MLRFLKLGPHDGAQVDYIDLASIVYVREVNASGTKDEKGPEVQLHFAGGATTRLSGDTAREFLGQFQAYIDRLHFQTPTFSGPGHSALSP